MNPEKLGPEEPPIIGTCPNCGMPVQADDVRCGHCGQRRKGAPPTKAERGARIATLVALILVGLPAALIGVCSVITAATSRTGGEAQMYAGIALVVGLIALAVFALVLWLFFRQWKK